jgi:hypothetical protein
MRCQHCAAGYAKYPRGITFIVHLTRGDTAAGLSQVALDNN